MTNNVFECYLEYVCPKCLHTLNECCCELRSNSLIHIDRNIQEHIRILNTKGYNTVNCCEGHYGKGYQLYIQFAKEHNFNDTNIELPSGFKYIKSQRIIEFMYSSKLKNEYAFDKMKEIKLESLLNWCKNLPDIFKG